ncbi:MAG: hypothetical protein MK234_06845, partial [Nitrospinales bacterium]|nr:hypothetical protein [Nitrospinales bacterium]
MSVSTTNLSNNQLKITFLFSALLHVVGFYILSGISFNQTSRSPDIVPIKVTTHVEKKGTQAMNVNHVTQQSPRQSTHSPKLVSTTLNEVFDSKPTLTYAINNRPLPSKIMLQARLPKDIDRLTLASNKSPSPSLIKNQVLFTK